MQLKAKSKDAHEDGIHQELSIDHQRPVSEEYAEFVQFESWIRFEM